MKKSLYDISEVCTALGTTSRTLRFYEKKGIIRSTCDGVGSRRKYSQEQYLQIKNVLALRRLGLSLQSILELQNSNPDLKGAIIAKRANLLSSINTRIQQINTLNEALAMIEQGTDLSSIDEIQCPTILTEDMSTVNTCTYAIINADTQTLFRHMSKRLSKYVPKDAFEAVQKDTMAPLGTFSEVEKIIADEKAANRIYSFVKYSNLGLKITFVFHNREIDGLWLSYYEISKPHHNISED